MADPRAVVPYHDPYDSGPYADDIFSFAENYNPNLADLSSSQPPTILDDAANIADPIGPLEDPIMWDMYNNHHFGNQAGPSEIRVQTKNQEERTAHQPSMFDHGNTRPLSVWPVEPVPFLCSCCQVLREIIHFSGKSTTKLEIHGRPGIISHSILMVQNSVDGVPQDPEYQMFDFCKKSIGNVKEFLTQYCNERKQAGYTMMQDPLSIFYETLCVGLEFDDNFNTSDFLDPFPTDLVLDDILGPSTESNRADAYQRNQTEQENNEERVQKTSLAAQRERTGKLTLGDFVQYFHLPIDHAAKKLHICPTVVKKVCRKYGLNRWPYRKIKSIQRQIETLTENLNTPNAEERARVEAEIERLQQVMTNFFAGVGPL